MPDAAKQNSLEAAIDALGYKSDSMNDFIFESQGFASRHPVNALSLADGVASRITDLYNAVATVRAEAEAQLKEEVR